MKSLGNVGTVVMQSISKLGNEVKTLSQQPLDFDRVRAPCDVRRLGVRNLGWTPWSVNGENVGASGGLLKSMTIVIEMQRCSGKIMPILLDVNVYYRLLKLMYHGDVVSLNLRGAMQQHPLVFGLWHAYAHCVKRTFMVFRSL